MEEYGHHLRFRKLLEDLKLDWKEATKNKGHLTTFDVPIDTWAEALAENSAPMAITRPPARGRGSHPPLRAPAPP
jgi:hypothetical protein